MSNQHRIPDPEIMKHHTEKLKEVVRMYDDLILLLDKAIAQAEEDIRNSPYGAYKFRNTKRLATENKELEV